MPLYKFIEKQYLDSFFSAGSLRLGTIYSYKDTVEHGESRGDKNEGVHHIKREVDKPVIHSKDNCQPIISEFFDIRGNGSISVEGISFVVQRKSKDAFIFCTSHTYTESLFRLWNEKEGLDSCYEITNENAFIESVSRKITSSANYSLSKPVVYIKQEIDWRSSHAKINPGLTKFNEYYWQKEHRMVWNPRGPCSHIKPWLIDVPEARSNCKPYAYIENGEIKYY